MSEVSQKRHALTSFPGWQGAGAQAAPGVQLEISPYLGYLNLRGDPGDERFLQTIHAALEQPLPLVSNTFTKALIPQEIAQGHLSIFWLGPDEWLLVTEPGIEKALAGRLRENLAGQCHSLTDLTGAQVLLRLSGGHARDALAEGCTLDLHPKAFKTGQCAQTTLAKASILIALTDDLPVFDVIVRRSFAEYAALWLQHSGADL